MAVARRARRGGPPGCFFHKHPGDDFPGPFDRVIITESAARRRTSPSPEPGSLTALAQMGVLEIHIWGSTWPDIERPDMLVFDLDPGPAVEWKALADGARLVVTCSASAGLESFVKTTGGKGLHVVAPLTPTEDWKEVRLFCRRVAEMWWTSRRTASPPTCPRPSGGQDLRGLRAQQPGRHLHRPVLHAGQGAGDGRRAAALVGVGRPHPPRHLHHAEPRRPPTRA